MEITPELVERLVTRLFPPDARAAVTALLADYGAQPHEREPVRVRVAVLKLAGGDLARLADALAAARRDYRDVLAWAEYPAELRAPTWRMPAATVAGIRAADRAQYEAWLAAHATPAAEPGA